ncbi:MAG: metallophosphoesterase [Myxococcota bacterium]
MPLFVVVVLALLGLPAVAVLAEVLALPAGGLRTMLLVAGGWGFVTFLVTVWAMVRRPRLRSPLWVAAITVPGVVWAAGTFLAIPWALLSWLPHAGPLGLVPYAIAATGVWTSFVPRREVVRVPLGSPAEGRLPVDRRRVHVLPTDGEGLRIVQITDPHLGAFRSEASLRALCERAVAAEPDLVLLTGDFFTMEGRDHPDALARALRPLRALSGRTFACYGNHDHEAPRAVAAALADAGVRLLVDEAAVVDTRVGKVQIVGLDHRWSRRDRHARVLHAHPRPEGALRVVLLHDPGAFRHLPEGEADLVLSGHTHGGHVGLVSLGLDWTAVSAIAGLPDHGLFARGTDRLYVHRGSGHYGFPLRIGVPMEESVIEVVSPRSASKDPPTAPGG